MYRGSETSFHITELHHKSEYLVRVCAVRQCSNGTQDLTGAYSPGVSFRTLEPKPLVTATNTTVASRIVEPKQLSDQQWAVIILLGFAVFAVIVAFFAQQIITYTNSSSQDGHNGSMT